MSDLEPLLNMIFLSFKTKIYQKTLSLALEAFKNNSQNEIAKTWPKNINDNISKEDWNWKANFGLNNTLEEAFK